MEEAIIIEDDDVFMIEDDDRDDVVLLERAPNSIPMAFFSSTATKHRASSLHRCHPPQSSMIRTQAEDSPDSSHSTKIPSIDSTTALVSGNPVSQDVNRPEDRAYIISSSYPTPMSRHEGYKPSLSWNIPPETGTTQEHPSTSMSFRRCTNDSGFSATSLNEMATGPFSTSRTSTPERRHSFASLISISDEEDGDEIILTQDTSSSTDDNIILIEDNDDFEFKLESQLLEKPEFEFLRSVSLNEKPKAQSKPKALRPIRNLPITSPYFECGSYLHGKLELRPMKTVELEDGDFVYIKHILNVEPEERCHLLSEINQDPSVKIRGLRLQRCKYLNGMLEKKMNEVCLCYEIDLDDKREPEEQSLVEVPLSSIKALRSLRWTNHHYPKYRNLDRDAVGDNEDAYKTGGLTVRWKYTCTYASTLAREQNIYAERTLEQLAEDWLSSIHRTSHTYLTSNTKLRTKWRGETIAGGSYVPECYEIEEDGDSVLELEQAAIIQGTQNQPKSCIIVDDDEASASLSLESQSFGAGGLQVKRKSDFSSSSDLNCDQGDSQPAKRVRQGSENDIEKIRQRLGRVMLSFDGVDYVRHFYNIGTPETNFSSGTENNLVSTGQVLDTNSSARNTSSNRCISPQAKGHLTPERSSSLSLQTQYLDSGLSCAFSPTPSSQIGINFSDLATPPPSGVIELSSSSHHSRSSSIAVSNCSRTHSLKESRTIALGQTLTYGDAFCGAGGTTRGATMAGLRVKWGFDFDSHACTTWRLNFPYATCYEMSSERFVALATPSPFSSYVPDDVKVDILHLSPPCQYFSPAHTIEGKNDEMNTASLFAVAAVIKVAKPRVVTLEQTFGILYPRFRGYFHSLICMFTSCGFSLRWAIVPLAQWGLPQRRFRLIIIASCPGEPLPPIPPPTHSSPSSPILNTHPFETVYETLRRIPTSAANHPIHLMPEKDLKPYDSHAILPRTMTTSGGDNWHPSGKRGFTDREFACLQGFPLQHQFGQNGIKRQIGNAVPPVVAKVLFEGIRRFMEGVDGIVGDSGVRNRGEDGGHEMRDEGERGGEDRGEHDLVGESDETHRKYVDGKVEIVKAVEMIELAQKNQTIFTGPLEVKTAGVCTGALIGAVLEVATSVNDLIVLTPAIVLIALRIGIAASLRSSAIENSQESWAVLVSAISKHDVDAAIESFQSRHHRSDKQVFISVSTENSFTITGPPSMLTEFIESGISKSAKHVSLPLGAAFHAPHLPMLDIHAIVQVGSLPYSVHIPKGSLVSTSTGKPYNSATFSDLLVEVIHDVLSRPMNLEVFAKGLAYIVGGSPASLIPIGPENCANYFKRKLQEFGCQMVDPENHKNLSRVPIIPRYSGSTAIVGMAGRFPGGTSLEDFWEVLENGSDLHKKIPADRFDVNTHYDSSGRLRNSTLTPYGVFIDNPGHFDARMFNMSPREAAQTDPMQRLLLTTTYEALEMSGYSPNRTPSTQSSRIGSFSGQTSDDWREVNSAQDIDTYFITGGIRAFGPGRLNYHFKWEGPSYSIDTACSSSFASIQVACLALRALECDTAVAGGASILTASDLFSGLSRGGFLSQTGGCKTFDDAADGYCRGDAVGTVVLKRFEDAIDDNDNILSVIRGIDTNHSAHAVSITHPRKPTQQRLFRSVLRQANLLPEDVDYVEMHGTGTQAGDFTELSAISGVFGNNRSSNRPLYIGTLKPNVGHSEAVGPSSPSN
ncbi:hypothetical protein EYC80_007134 [Monilinia laxa]|uniref:Ketosynthase family 3 (KS3) domain-containing protein n=1 Tax=Monilinia laxa TaxID=61186 RepID=A0A5N6K094_MONLA|nr:hypothetical protein EYC80_007134 [Monilinia laxa]